MSFTSTQLEELEAAYASGALTVRHSTGDSVTYQSAEQMWAAILRIRKALTAVGSRHQGSVMGYKRDA